MRFKNQDGASSIEYGLIAAMISVVCVTILLTIGPEIHQAFGGTLPAKEVPAHAFSPAKDITALELAALLQYQFPVISDDGYKNLPPILQRHFKK